MQQNGDPSTNTFVDLPYLMVELGRRKRNILISMLLGIVVALLIHFLTGRVYLAETKIVPANIGQTTNGWAASQMAGFTSGFPGLFSAGRNVDELYADLFHSRSVQELVVQNLGLVEHYKKQTKEEAQERLNERISVVVDKKSGLMTLSVSDADAVMASKIANELVVRLRERISSLIDAEANQKKSALEVQAKRLAAELSNAEKELQKLIGEAGILSIEAHVGSLSKKIIELKSREILLEVELSVMRSRLTEQNQMVQSKKLELAEIRRQIQAENSIKRDELAELDDLAIKIRDYKGLEIAYTAVSQQLQIARIEASREGAVLQQVDLAVPPRKPHGLGLVKLTILFSLASAFLASVFIMFHAAITRAYMDQWGRIRKAWSL